MSKLFAKVISGQHKQAKSFKSLPVRMFFKKALNFDAKNIKYEPRRKVQCKFNDSITNGLFTIDFSNSLLSPRKQFIIQRHVWE